ncbi:GGDEF domain-containing protein [Neptuniibacter sp.]|uniref:GGDEF domain-containing protein n=1 Tax=Neptuniibacter sp. TaxID=1962643 RepID=UPI00262F4414|nr:diguanylate cyclase [Neptuniibacter sp.]MCP4598053.1 diguanylate cyclase [Neptuniibacter sp.]
MDEVSLQQLLKGNHRALLLVIDALPFPIYYKDREGFYLGCNKAYEEYVGAKREEIIGKQVYDLFDKVPASIFDASDKELIDNPGVQVYETPVHRSKQETRYVKFEKATFVNEKGEVAGLIGAIIDITEQKNLEAKLKRLASYDDLTGIYNRREGRKQLKRLCKDAARKERPISAILLDLDNFKAINDGYGHDTGDIILKTAAECLNRYSRANDVLCRYGGEEFLIILPETSLEDAAVIAERYREKLSQIEVQITSSETLRVTASFGVGELDLEFTDRDLMLKQADLALYRAKDQGKNRVCY